MRYAIYLALAVSLLFTSCSVERRSDEFACAVPTDCTGGRLCVEGWCVWDGDGGPVDAPIDADPTAPDAPVIDGAIDATPVDAFECPAACTNAGGTCSGTFCLFVCDSTDQCASQVVCPAGMACQVMCTGMNSCAGGVDCTSSTDCRVDCGAGACDGNIGCAPGAPCAVACSGSNSCGGGVSCNTACSCAVTCSGVGSCATQATCPTGCGSGAGCRANGSCNDC